MGIAQHSQAAVQAGGIGVSRGLAEATLTLLRAKLGGVEMVPFATAVVTQLSLSPGATADEGATARGVVRLIRAASAGDIEDAAAELYANPALFAAFFQNLDLLFAVPLPVADAVTGLVMAALERAV